MTLYKLWSRDRSYKCVDDDILLVGCKAAGGSVDCFEIVVESTSDVGLISRDFRGRTVKSCDILSSEVPDIWGTSVTMSACVTLHFDNGLSVT